MKSPRTLVYYQVHFGDPDRAFEYACKMRWPDGKGLLVPLQFCRELLHQDTQALALPWLQSPVHAEGNRSLRDSPLGLDKWMTAF